MKHNQAVRKAFALIAVCLFALAVVGTQTGKAAKTIVVPNDYPTISAAVQHASAGDTVQVQSGVYHENVMIDKSITMTGEEGENTVVIGTGEVERGGRAVFTLAANSIKLMGFTIESLNYSSSTDYASGIFVEGDNCAIRGNTIQNTYIGIFCSVQSGTTISQNIITGSSKDGIRFLGGDLNVFSENNIFGNAQSGLITGGYSNTVVRNNLTGNWRGMGLSASQSVVFGNRIIGNTESGIFLDGSNDIISANDIDGNKWGMYFTSQLASPHDNNIYQNNFDNTKNTYMSPDCKVQLWNKDKEGNYWKSYIGADVNGDGIGDKAYDISANNTDNYPLLTPFKLSNTAEAPAVATPEQAAPNSLVASWSFDVIEPSGLTPDATGNNPASVGYPGDVSYAPVQVEGQQGKALSFNGLTYVSIPVTPQLEITGEITIDAWVNVQQFKNVTYNNILIEATRDTASLPTRVVGLAINGLSAKNNSIVPQGALIGYVYIQNGGFNEIATTDPVMKLNQRTHVVFTRSETSGMHIYVDGKKQNVTVTAGTANPTGSIRRENEIYIGHDSITLIDDVSIRNNAINLRAQPIWMEWWLWATVAISGAAIGVFVYFKKTNKF
jgi:parallel beta-helix repeat protein